MLKDYLESETKQSLMRLITWIMAVVIALIALGQLAIQIITAFKDCSTIYQPNWYGLGAFFLIVVLGKAGQKHIENKQK